MNKLKRLHRWLYMWLNREAFRVFESREPEIFEIVMAICVFSKVVSTETRLGRYMLNRYHGLPAEDRELERFLFVISETDVPVKQRNWALVTMIRLGDIPPVNTDDHNDGIAVGYFFKWMGWGDITDRAAYHVIDSKTTN